MLHNKDHFFIDSHCHLNYKDFEGEDIEQIIQRANDVGIHGFLNICTEIDEAPLIVKTAEKFPSVYASVGVHPHDAEPGIAALSPDAMVKWLCDMASHPKVVAFGETGLDFYYDNSPRQLQKDSFRAHLEAATQAKLPVIVHTRSANEDTIDILKEYKGCVQGVIHCFSETRWLAEQALELGFYISISGIATFKKAAEIRDIIVDVPLEKLLVETDAPFLAPIPYRGKRNEPAFMIETAKLMADLKGVSLEKMAEITTKNFQTLFSKATF